MTRTIAGWPAELASVAVETPDANGAARAIEIFRVARPERLIDRDALLRGAPGGGEPPYWALVWIGARAIAARMLDRPPLSGSRVLDVGCGLGLSGLAAGLSGAEVTFVDHVDEPLAFVAESARRLGLCRFSAERIDFTRERLGEKFDLVLAADVVYDPNDYDALVDFLLAHLAPAGVLLLTESLRADAKHVVRALERAGLGLRTDDVWIPEDGKLERTWLHELRDGDSAPRVSPPRE